MNWKVFPEEKKSNICIILWLLSIKALEISQGCLSLYLDMFMINKFNCNCFKKGISLQLFWHFTSKLFNYLIQIFSADIFYRWFTRVGQKQYFSTFPCWNFLISLRIWIFTRLTWIIFFPLTFFLCFLGFFEHWLWFMIRCRSIRVFTAGIKNFSAPLFHYYHHY